MTRDQRLVLDLVVVLVLERVKGDRTQREQSKQRGRGEEEEAHHGDTEGTEKRGLRFRVLGSGFRAFGACSLKLVA